MSAYRTLARRRRWTPQTPGRVDRLVRRFRATHHTCSVAEVLARWLGRHGIGKDDKVTYGVPSFWGVGEADVPKDTPKPEPVEGMRPGANERVWQDFPARMRSEPQKPSWPGRPSITFAGFDLTPLTASVKVNIPEQDTVTEWFKRHREEQDEARRMAAQKTSRYPDMPWAVVLPQSPAIGESFRIGWPPWQGYAWPPAGDERRPPQWPGGDHNKNDNKDNRSKDMGTTNGVGGAQDLAAVVARASDEVQAALEAEDQRLREQRATDVVHSLAARFLDGIRAAEDLGLEVRVEQTYERQGNNEWRRLPVKTERLRVGVTKQVG